ncbi:MAG: Ldh family oxidoreductase [Gammaproteobacteria bacterium]|nr:Ldh family oxidoreductase [Gammaproteobacteria bacterium]
MTQVAIDVFCKLGTTEGRAREVAEHLVEANLKGHDFHGVGMIPNYVSSAVGGRMAVNADAKIARDKGAVMLVDGQRGFGQVVGRQATEMGIQRARETGIACVGVRDCHHLGRIGTYGELAAAAGLVLDSFRQRRWSRAVRCAWGGREEENANQSFLLRGAD